MQKFSQKLLSWFAKEGRKHLPWQVNPTPYRVWVSEIMLQQTQVNTVIPYFGKFMQRFPDLQSLAGAELDAVLHLWTGLGYYSRARNLHSTAQAVKKDYSGNFPRTVEALVALPGIGRSTAGAILALSFGQRATILDGNVKRVLTRYHGIQGWPEQTAVKKRLWELAETLTPLRNVAQYTQAIMDLGATLCTRSKPRCEQCPLSDDCQARLSDSIASIPGKKPRQRLPVRQVAMFLLQNEHREILLQKRPPTGIWGGLWSFPESPEPVEEPAIVKTHFTRHSTAVWPGLRHSFSHYHLDITPVHSRVESPQNAVMESGQWLWYPLDDPATVGLAAPVKKLLEQLAATLPE